MDVSFHISQNGLRAGTIRQSAIANNLSNLTTDGFRAQIVDPATVSGPGTQVLGVRDTQTLGSPRITGGKTDMFIGGEGFLRVTTPDGIAYTRNGQLHTDADGNLTTSSGNIIEPQITIPEDSENLRILRDGTVLSYDQDDVVTDLGQIELTRFINPSGLISIGENLYVKGPNSGDALDGVPGEDGFGAILHEAVEESNVDPSREITNQLVNQRYYQMNLRSFQTSDAMVSRTLDLFS